MSLIDLDHGSYVANRGWRWRAAGNGQDLQPANSYNKRPRDSTGPDDEGHESSIYPSQYTPSGAARNKYPEMGKVRPFLPQAGYL